MFHFLHQMMASSLTPAITSIQEVSISFSITETSKTATINAVDTSRSVILYGGVRMEANASTHSLFSGLSLTNATTVTASRDSHLNREITVNATIIEFSPNIIRSVQSGYIQLSGSNTGTSAITSVDTERSLVVFNGQTTTTNTIDRSLAVLTLEDATTVRADKGDSNNDMTVYYSVIEFSHEAVRSIQPLSISLSDPDTSITTTINAVDMDHSVLFFQGNNLSSSTTTDIYAAYAYLSNATEVVAERHATTSSTNVTINVAVVEFNPQMIDTIQRGRTVIPINEKYTDTSISYIPTDRSYVSYLGFKSTKGDHLEDHHYATILISNNTTLRIERGDDPHDTVITVSWEVITFK